MRIYKYAFDRCGHALMADVVSMPMPKNSRVIACQMQQEVITLWAEVNADAELEQRLFRIVPTGGDVPIGYTYIDTVQMLSGALVWHIYEKGASGE